MSSRLFFTLAASALLISVLITIIINTQHHRSFDDHRWDWEALPLVGAAGPESLAFDPLGQGPYTGVSDGRVIKWDDHEKRWIDFAITSLQRDGCGGSHDHNQVEHICGRPLGLRFNQTNGDLYIADAYMGLLRVGPEGGLAISLATQAQGIPLQFTNGLDVDPSSGTLYFTDSSSRYQRRNHIALILRGDNTGRLMKYDPQSKQVEVLLDNLSFPNGVEISKDGNSILLVETTSCRVLKYWIKTPKAGTHEVFSELPGFPDNIKKSPRGGYWVGIHSRKEKFSELVLSHPWIGNALLKLPFDITEVQSFLAKYRGSGGMAVRLGENGELLEVFHDKIGNRLKTISEVMEKDGVLWIGSVNLPFAGRYKI